MDLRSLQKLMDAVDRVHESGDLNHVVEDGFTEILTQALRDWDGEDTEQGLVLGVFCFYRYLVTKERTDMLLAVMTLTPCLLYDDMALPPDMLPFLADYSVCEAEELRREARDSPDPALAERAVSAWRRIVSATPEDHPRYTDRQRSFIRAFRLLFARRGDTAELDRAVADAQRELARQGHPDRLVTLWKLHEAFEERYEATGNKADHEAALACAEEMAAWAVNGDATGAQLAFLYGEKLYRRFLRDPGASDLRKAIALVNQASQVPCPEQPARLLVLAQALRIESAAARDPRLLDAAIGLLEQANGLVRRDHEDYPRIQSTLAGLYFLRWGKSGSDDLDRAQAAVTEAAMCLPRDASLSHLSSAIWFARYEHTGDGEFLYNALVTGERAARRRAGDADVLSHLSRVQASWYARTGSVGDLDRAIANGHAAVDLLAPDDPRRPAHLSELAFTHFRRFSSRGEPEALPRAIDLWREAAALAPDDHVRAANLAYGLRHGYEATHDAGRLDEAIIEGERALKLAPAGGPARPKILLALGAALRLRAGRTGDAGDLRRAADAVDEALGRPGLAPVTEMALRLEQAELASAAGAPAEALRAFEAAVGLLPGIALRSRHHEDREFELAVHSGLGAKAAATAVAAGRPDRALELLEQARGVLADTLRGASAPAASDLCRAAARGPVVTVSATETSGLALLVTPRGVHAVPLPDLTTAEAMTRHKDLKAALGLVQDPATDGTRRARACDDIQEVLAWLWRVIVGPVLDALGAIGWTGDRLWWCPAGVLALLPLHAAGDGNGSAMERVVSSYVPTVRALGAVLPGTAPRGGALAVAMSRTPGQAPLPNAASEAHSLRSLLGATVLRNEQATRDAVLSALPGNRIVHFACHADADTHDPTRGRLLLHDRPLTPREILPLRLDADLAYLSACATSDVLSITADEALHITAAFHLAGFRHVIGTLWPIDDEAAAGITHAFYTRIAAQGPDQAPRALHAAVLELRHAHPDRPELWASHLHVGP
ncbi:CHAT domain-containing protein [Actinocorallia sp. B10E7]|uniref:CHAT domain-containing protein n=1 Tax=Actinocorallia sp. B10E7 TaxID=3153558 RepID=UPI00325CCE96